MIRRRAAAGLLLGAAAAGAALADDGSSRAGSHSLTDLALEARQTIAVIDWFYVKHRACPQTSREEDRIELQHGLGDGFSVDREGRFTAIRGISMSTVWLYYTSPTHPDRCTLLRSAASGPALIWRRGAAPGRWAIVTERGERPIKFDPYAQ